MDYSKSHSCDYQKMNGAKNKHHEQVENRYNAMVFDIIFVSFKFNLYTTPGCIDVLYSRRVGLLCSLAC